MDSGEERSRVIRMALHKKKATASPPPKERTQPLKDKPAMIRLDAEEKAALLALATDAKMTLSAYIRTILRDLSRGHVLKKPG